MGQPAWGHAQAPVSEPGNCAVGCEEATGGTETSQYLEEQKSTEIPLVVVSERGGA